MDLASNAKMCQFINTCFANVSKTDFKVSVAGCDMLRTFGLGEADLQPCIDR